MLHKMIFDLDLDSLSPPSCAIFNFYGGSIFNQNVDVLFDLNDINPRHFGELRKLYMKYARCGMVLPTLLASYDTELAVIWHEYHVRLKGL